MADDFLQALGLSADDASSPKTKQTSPTEGDDFVTSLGLESPSQPSTAEPIPPPERKPPEPYGGGLWSQARRIVPQVPLGVARGLVDMVQSGAPAGAQEAMAFGGYDMPPEAGNPETYEKYRKEVVDPALGLEGELSPKTLPEKMASGAGRAMPWAMLGAGPEGVGPALAIQGAGGAMGEAAEHYAPEEWGPYANIIGNVVGSMGATSLANKLLKLAREPNEFGMLFTKGQRTQDPAQLSLEENIRKGGEGKLAQAVMNRFEGKQNAAAEAATDELGAGLGGAPTTPKEAGETIDTALTRKAEGHRQAGNAFFERSAEKEAWVHDTHDLARQVRVGLHDAQFPIPDELNGLNKAARALRLIENMSDETGAASVQKMNEVRKHLNRIFPDPNTEDGLATLIIKRAYDNWEHDVVTNRLLTGDPTALDDIKRGNEQWKSYKDMTARKNGPDKVIATIVNGDESPEKVANFVIGSSSIGGASMAAQVVARIKQLFPGASDEFNALRQAVFNKLTVDPLKEGASLSPQKIATAIRKQINGPGAPVARELFTAEERAKFLRFAADLERQAPKMVNPSGTASMLMAHILPSLQSMGALGGAAMGYWSGDPRWLSLTGAALFRDVNSVRRALNAVRDPMPKAINQTRNILPIAGNQFMRNRQQEEGVP